MRFVSENHAGKLTVVLPKEIHLDEEFYWEMALVELFRPKQDSLSDHENLWYEIQESKKKWKRKHIPTSLFYSVSSLLDYVRQLHQNQSMKALRDEFSKIQTNYPPCYDTLF